jgi:hypothetical protein
MSNETVSKIEQINRHALNMLRSMHLFIDQSQLFNHVVTFPEQSMLHMLSTFGAVEKELTETTAGKLRAQHSIYLDEATKIATILFLGNSLLQFVKTMGTYSYQTNSVSQPRNDDYLQPEKAQAIELQNAFENISTHLVSTQRTILLFQGLFSRVVNKMQSENSPETPQGKLVLSYSIVENAENPEGNLLQFTIRAAPIIAPDAVPQAPAPPSPDASVPQ